jgi:hypothetical protein
MPVTLEHRHSLVRLAQLLRFRFGRRGFRSFVMLAVDGTWAHQINTDDQETQQIPVMQSPWMSSDQP